MKKLLLVLLSALMLSTSVSAQWVVSLDNKPTQCFCYTWDNTTVYAGCTSSIYKTTNDGLNWSLLNTFNQTVNCITRPGNSTTVLFVGTNDGIYTTTNAGINWSLVFTWSGLQVLALQYISTGSGVLIAGTSNAVYRSTDQGVSWDIPQLGGKRINYLSYSMYSYASTSNGVYKSTDYGVSWTLNTQTIQYNINFVESPGASGTLIAGITGGYLWTTNSGNNWYKLTQASVLSFTRITGLEYLMGDSLGRVFHVNANNPSTLWDKYIGLPNTPIRALCSGTNYVFAGSTGSYQKIWRAPVSYVIAVKQISSEIPGKYTLEQNYPDPFNPSTTIHYTIPTKGLVTLKVYDALGRVVTTLVNETQTPGAYAVKWNASNNPSGVYFYRIETNNFTDTKRMVLIK
jgi:hypothetical protein